MTKILLKDRAGIPLAPGSARVVTDEGYLRVPGRVARAGNVQQYLASELELTDRGPNEIVNVYRPPESVFAPDSLSTYDNSDITVQHPDDLVTAVTWQGVSVGHAISAGRQEGDWVVVDLLIKDQEAIKAIDAGTVELSAGYLAEYVHQPGVTPDGTPYEFIQRGIAVNHIALCDHARAGREARLFDHKPAQEAVMTHKVTLDNGVKVEVADEQTQTLIQSTLDGLRKQVADSQKAVQDAEEAKQKAEAKADAADEENEELKKKASDDAISARVTEVISAMDSARKVAGDEFTCDSVVPVVIYRSALDSAKAPCKRYESWDKAPEAYVVAAIDMAVEKKEAEDEEEEEHEKRTSDSHRRFADDMAKSKTKTGDAQATRDANYQAFLDKRYGKKETA
ncbi:DUF2213 domain-containing protein [Billgrantia tianxiuensis]|uniref:DUF2213 domain-containing protein n=1 Tax=Billgrantia tianxiuensis TaxID=2497861 RepID=A0A6I6SSC7_9GAMM|nr:MULTISPECIES: DUF2213 domain-containing protein [Halomonas]MCE8034608.1 DUF2213 domain-containing protein [Halomonas sp. MCCC 1A11057]QHC50475.1 DUF2213 domain-containing protein [Halomonas tianxiuensis]